MLLFIVRDRRTGRRYKVFQYISCYCLSNLLQIPCIIFFISIHLMLLFIRFCWIVWLTHPGISIHLMLLFIPITGFLDGINIEFQYISCYCLSSSILLSISLTHISIHLMLLFISERGSNENANRYFNTSHVTVYLYPAIPGNFVIQISIHLMLLFISLACYRCFLC